MLFPRASGRPGRLVFEAAACVFMLAGCASGGGGEQPVAGATAGLDPRLARLAVDRPDALAGVLVRTAGPAGAEERAALEEAGLRVGSVAGTIVTGRIAAGSAAALARLPFVVYIELAEEIRGRLPPLPAPGGAGQGGGGGKAGGTAGGGGAVGGRS